jgi:hypothetical protein
VAVADGDSEYESGEDDIAKEIREFAEEQEANWPTMDPDAQMDGDQGGGLDPDYEYGSDEDSLRSALDFEAEDEQFDDEEDEDAQADISKDIAEDESADFIANY